MSSELIEQANSWLADKGYKVRLTQIGDLLYLRGTFPPKPGSEVDRSTQQRISLKLPANMRGIELAKKEGDRVGKLLELGKFEWNPYIRHQSIGSVAEWVGKLKAEYFAEGGSVATWEGDYEQSYKKLPPDRQLTVRLLVKVAKETAPNSKVRQRVCMAFARLARFAELEADNIVSLRGNYSPNAVDPRTLPDDLLIARWHARIENPAWRWCFGMLACYGLRPHELFHCDLRDFPTVRVGRHTKTGERFIWPLYPEWADTWGLEDRQLPNLKNIDALPNTKLGTKISGWFYKRKFPKLDGENLTAYDLRHTFARRALEFGFSPDFGAKMMGHSSETHNKVYRRWIDERVYRAVYDAALNRSDRPLPP
ncbi:MAG: integrase [Cyanobacteria bacterium J06648_10]